VFERHRQPRMLWAYAPLSYTSYAVAYAAGGLAGCKPAKSPFFSPSGAGVARA